MPSNTTQFNRTGSAALAAADETLSCTIPNGNVDQQIEIHEIHYGVTKNDISATNIGFSGVSVIQNHVLMSGIAYSSFAPTNLEGRSGEYIDFHNSNHYGTNVIRYQPPLRVEPGFNCVVVLAPATDSAGGLISGQRDTLTVIGRLVVTEKRAVQLGNYVLR